MNNKVLAGIWIRKMMPDENKDDEFNQCNSIMTVKQVLETSPSFTCVNNLHELIHKMEWENVIKRVKKRNT